MLCYPYMYMYMPEILWYSFYSYKFIESVYDGHSHVYHLATMLIISIFLIFRVILGVHCHAVMMATVTGQSWV